MLNQTILVGRIVNINEIDNENNQKRCTITLGITRSYKNVNGEYEVDFIECILWNGIANDTLEYCKKGDLVGVKGRLQTNDNKTVVIAEKITVLTTK